MVGRLAVSDATEVGVGARNSAHVRVNLSAYPSSGWFRGSRGCGAHCIHCNQCHPHCID